uniref:Immunoglobulin domain-containing protein n=1 Tax=Cyprinus carpio TaxID=7962 RepID=A0A8C1PTJ1_CYPCA
MSEWLFLTVLHVFVVVTDAVKSVSVTKGGTVTLQINVTEIQKDDLIQWIFGDIKLAEINKTEQQFYTYDGPDGRFRDRLKLDHQTGSLNITDTRTTDSGLYEAKISQHRKFSFIMNLKDSVSVTEGDSVTLKSGVTEIQTDDEIEWWFNRLQLDSQTGDLKISNIRTTDSGEYKLQISSPRGSPPRDDIHYDVKSVSVLVGDSVTLQTGLTDIQRDAVIQWRFDHQKSPVAEINRTAGIFNTYDGADGRFRDRLQLDHQTGSLIIKNMRITHSGLYEADIIRTSSKHTIHKTFNVTVSGESINVILNIFKLVLCE